MEAGGTGAKPSYTNVYDHYASKMMRISLNVGVIWAVASICLSIILATVFLQDQWIGDTPLSKGPGNFGLWHWCSDSRDGVDACRGSLSDFSSILSPAWRAATVFSGLAVLTSVVTLLAWLTICVASTLGLFKVSGCLQIISGVFMLITILSFPAGWDNSSVISVCGPEADDFLLGTCDIRWVYMLAVVGCADCFLLGLLALTLGWRQIITTEEEEEGPGYLVTNMGNIGPDIKTQAAIMHDGMGGGGPGVSRESLYSHNNNFLL